VPALLDRDRLAFRLGQLRMRLSNVLLDLRNHLLRFVRATVREQPARALRNQPPDRQDAERQNGADQEAEPPADRLADVRKELVREEGRHGRAEPPAAVDRQGHAAAHARGNQLVDGRVDRRVLAADPGAREDPKSREAPEVPGEPRRDGEHEVDAEGHHEQLLASDPVREVTEEQRTADGAEQVPRPE